MECCRAPNIIHAVYNPTRRNGKGSINLIPIFLATTYSCTWPPQTEPYGILCNIQSCVTVIKSWMTTNMLQLNMDQAEDLVLTK